VPTQLGLLCLPGTHYGFDVRLSRLSLALLALPLLGCGRLLDADEFSSNLGQQPVRVERGASKRQVQPSRVSNRLGCCFFLLGRGGQLGRKGTIPAFRPKF
jgi:hypothetical protein